MKKLQMQIKDFKSIRVCTVGKKFISSFIDEYTKDGIITINKTQAKKIIKDFEKYYNTKKSLQLSNTCQS